MYQQCCKKKTVGGYNIQDIIIERIEQFINEKVIEYYLEPYKRNDTLTLSKNFKKDTYEYVIKRIKQFENYKNMYQKYVDLSYETLAIVKRSYDIYLQNISLEETIKNMLEQEYIKNRLLLNQPIIQTEMSVEVEFDSRYLDYIDKYGVPMNGIFDPKKLSEFL